jgi:hypothetical protein
MELLLGGRADFGRVKQAVAEEYSAVLGETFVPSHSASPTLADKH